MSSSKKTFWIETLPDPLPANPLEIAAQWLAQAQHDAAQPNPNSMVLATVDSHGHPSARVVLCKEIAVQQGYLLFYTNYRSRKGIELQGNPRAAILFHWDHVHRQVRAEGLVEPLSDPENDAYFRTGKSRSGPGPASRASPWARAPHSQRPWLMKRSASASLTAVPARRNPTTFPWRCRDHPIGVDIACMSTP
jgi:pyridoxine/pyridoxamine 5'-phosphate oxidase